MINIEHSDGNCAANSYSRATGLTYNPEGNGGAGSFYISGRMFNHCVAEISKPAVGGTAKYIQSYTDSTNGTWSQIADCSNGCYIGGHLIYNNNLYLTAFSYYDAAWTQTKSLWRHNLTLSNQSGMVGPVAAGPGNQGMYNQYMDNVPTAFQGLLGGPAVIGGCCTPITSRTSLGPALYAFDPERPGTVTPLLGYPDGHQTLNPFGASGSHPEANPTTRMAGVSFVEGTDTILFVGTTGKGEYCYGGSECGDPTSSYKGVHAYPYVHYMWAYDVNDLAAVKAGTKQQWEVFPYAHWEMPNLGDMVDEWSATGVAFDPAANRLYVLKARESDGGIWPQIYVYSVNTTPDTTPPSSPTSLAASSPSQSGITVTWTAATDNIAVSNYLVERCQGTGCSTFTQVGTPTASPFVDTGLTPNTFYNYHVRATDAALNLSGWSNVVGATTQSGGGSVCNTANVNTVSQLVNAVNTANSNASCSTTILIADGTYTLSDMLPITAPNMTIKGASGDRTKVILQGDAMSSSATVKIIFRVDANNFTAENMTLQKVGWHLIQIVGENNRDDAIIRNVVFRDSWEQMVKITYVDTNMTVGSDNGLIENSLFEFTSGQAGQYYTGGIDAHNATNWIVRGNTFKNIISPSGAVAEHAIHFWSNSEDTLVERNLIVNCDRGIGFGLVQGRGHLRGIIRNNMIYHAAGNGSFADVAIEADESPNTQIYNNTIFMQNNYSNAIEYRFPLSSGIVIRNNLTNKSIQARDGATATLSNNITNAQASWFVNPSQGDLHLASGSTSANNAGMSVSGLTNDYDGDIRPQGGGIDVGADEYGSNSTAVACNTVTPANFSDSAYNGYGAPYDVFAGNAQLIDAKCIASDTHTIQATIGKVNDTTRIVYTKGYYYDPGTSNWTQFTGTCTGLLNGEWCAGPITRTVTDPDISTASANTPVYMVGMTCSLQGGGWKCGCRDTACANFSWQVQGAGR